MEAALPDSSWRLSEGHARIDRVVSDGHLGVEANQPNIRRARAG